MSSSARRSKRKRWRAICPAIAIYRKLADDRSTPADIAARSLLRVGRCYERLGSTEARKAYERILSQFAGQEAVVAEARQRLTAISANDLNPPEEGVVVRKLQGDLQGYVSISLTQDGRYAVITRGRTGLDLLDLITGERKPIHTSTPMSSPDEVIMSSAISPDGRRLVVDFPHGASSGELRLLDRNTGAVRTIMKSDTDFRLPPEDWFRDGRTVLIRPFSEKDLAEKKSTLHLLDVDTGATRSLTVPGFVVDARPSPDGQFLAYSLTSNGASLTREGSKIYVGRIDGSESHLIAAPENVLALAGWSPDGRHVLYVSDELGTDHLWAARIRDGNPVGEPLSIAKGLANAQRLTVTASGSVILTIRGRINSYTATVDPSTGAIRGSENVNANVNASVANAIWSPEGKRMVYLTMRPEATGDKVTELYLRETGSRVERKLGSFPLIPRKMSWSPDGKAIIMPRIVDNGSAVYRYWIDDGRSELLVPAKSGEHYAKAFPKLSPDGRTVYYLEGAASLAQSKLIRYDLAAGRGIPIATISSPFDLAPDGDHLVLSSLDPASKRMTVQVITSDGQPVRELVRLGPDERVMSLAWAPDGKWIVSV